MSIKKKLAIVSLIALIIFAALTALQLLWIINTPPQAEIIMSPMKAEKGETVFFSGEASYDPNGVIVSYEWDFGDGNKATGINVQHSYIKAGVYTVKLKVTDDDELSSVSEMRIVVVTVPPQAKISVEKTEINFGEAMVFNGANSEDLDGEIVSYQWDFGDGTTASGEIVSHSYYTQGIYKVKLTVKDDDGLLDVVQLSVEVKPPRSLPTGTFLTKKLEGGEGELTIENGLDWDAVLILCKSNRPSAPLIGVYIQSEDSYTITSIPDGFYILYFATGTDWNSDLNKFTIVNTYERFEEELEFETTRTATSIYYTTYRVTLHTVPWTLDGAKTVSVPEKIFPVLD